MMCGHAARAGSVTCMSAASGPAGSHLMPFFIILGDLGGDAGACCSLLARDSRLRTKVERRRACSKPESSPSRNAQVSRRRIL